ncbi:MAG: sulfotransferase family protein, partial [Gammaproteobacteria bacterium]|nr:sulfotransferase family protein [Gammaproteobacteria bacterium]
MIISHKHRFIFFAVPRTATHALRQALRPCLGDNDWEQQALFGKQSIPVPGIATIGHGHVSFQQLRKNLPAQTWSSYFKFGFVRNPFDRFVSTCLFRYSGRPGCPGLDVGLLRRAMGSGRWR